MLITLSSPALVCLNRPMVEFSGRKSVELLR